MLAEEYGYAVSQGPAAYTPGLLDRLKTEKRGYVRMVASVGLLLLAGAVLTWAWLVPQGHTDAVPVFIGAAVVLGSFFGLGGSFMLSRALSRLRLAWAHPFQAWPCQLEQTHDRERVILLLAPDGSVARELRSDVPDHVWHRMADGRGMLWIAGDLRFQCLVATENARDTWLAKGTPYGGMRGPRSGRSRTS